MKIDKKTLIQYVVLILLVLGAAYYFLFYSPSKARQAELELELTAKQDEWNSIQMRLATEGQLDAAILDASDTIENLSERMFVNIEQEDALKLSNDLNKKGKIVFDNVTFSESYDEDLNTKIVDETLSFTADYYDVMDYMKYIRKYRKNIAILSTNLDVVEFDNMDEENLVADVNEDITEDGEVVEVSEQGVDSESEQEDAESESDFEKPPVANLVVSMSLRYRSVPYLEQLGVAKTELLKDIKSKRDLAKGPFNQYNEYKAMMAEKDAVKEIEGKKEDSLVEIEMKQPREFVYDFEDGNFFFVGSSEDIVGSSLRSVIRMNGSFASDLNFDFISPREYNCANLVFENDIILNRKPESVVMNVYAFNQSDHKIGLILLDSVGNEYKVEFAGAVDWTEWKELKAALPEEALCPLKIQRVYVEGIGYEQICKGRYLFDLIELEYPLPQKEQEQE